MSKEVQNKELSTEKALHIGGVRILFKNLFAENKTKRGSKPCKHCGKDIGNGELYTSVSYNDGFLKRGYGAFHNDCWKFLYER